MDIEILEGYNHEMGIEMLADGFVASTISHSARCSMVLYERNVKNAVKVLDFPLEYRMGDVWNMRVKVDDIKALKTMEYAFFDGEHIFADPCGKSFSGRDAWGKLDQVHNQKRSPLYQEDFDWEGDKPLHRSESETILYRLHVRGFTKSASSKCVQRGTFEGIVEKIDYLQTLGITAIDLMPCQEFEEIMMPDRRDPYGNDLPTGKINYWGYTRACHYAPKASFSKKRPRNAVNEMKTLVKEMHRAGIEVIVEFYFDGSEIQTYVLGALRYWVREFHLDGIHITGRAPLELIAQDPYLKRTKIIAQYYPQDIDRSGHLSTFNDNFLVDMRKFLKGDEGMLERVMFHVQDRQGGIWPIHYMADVRGFSLQDMVSYDIKHNEANGEDNRDGSDYNYSWNCGTEGVSRKKGVLNLRKKQIKNALLLLFLSQGIPCIVAGDEFGQSRKGNNNAYCQDNEISWIDWKLSHKNEELLKFVQKLIAFRKAHRAFCAKEAPRLMDFKGYGKPDISYHGVNVWQPRTEHWRRQLGVLYFGKYNEDQSIYVLYNMHWESHKFDLPHPETNQKWHVVIDTTQETGFLPLPLPVGAAISMPPRSIKILVSQEAFNLVKVTKVPKRKKLLTIEDGNKKSQ